MRNKVLVGSISLAALTLLVGGTLDMYMKSSSQQMSVSPHARTTQLYDIPNFVYQRTQMHFPQAEENWLDMAAEGKIGDDVKPERILHNLNAVISDARSHALEENYEARVKAKTDAMNENYDVYDVHHGKVVHKIYGKQVGGSVTLKPKEGSGLSQLAQPQIEGGMMMKQRSKVQQAKAQKLSYAVTVPAGLKSGQRFIAKIPNRGSMLVTVPPGVSGGQVVAIQLPGAHAAAARMLHPRRVHHEGSSEDMKRAMQDPPYKTTHPFADKMMDQALRNHYSAVPHSVYGMEH
eukprot:765214-Hanusia_phi.AAC.4